MGRWMAIDYGLKRVGLAVTDPLRIIARALETVKEPELIDYLKKYLKEEEVDLIVVGDPLQLDNSPSELTQYVDKLVLKLRSFFQIHPSQNMMNVIPLKWRHVHWYRVE